MKKSDILEKPESPEELKRRERRERRERRNEYLKRNYTLVLSSDQVSAMAMRDFLEDIPDETKVQKPLKLKTLKLELKIHAENLNKKQKNRRSGWVKIPFLRRLYAFYLSWKFRNLMKDSLPYRYANTKSGRVKQVMPRKDPIVRVDTVTPV